MSEGRDPVRVPRKRSASLPALSSEIVEADLGDVRLTQRLALLVDSLADRAGDSFPKALDDAELEGAYRFFGNAKVTPDAILSPHFRQTARRAAASRNVLVIHDTTQFEFPGATHRPGLGRLIRPGQGFFGHFALAISADGAREPLGLLNLETMFRLDKLSSKPRKQRPNRGESARWVRDRSEGSNATLDGAAHAIHVMDREADSYAILAALEKSGSSFVIRSFQDRASPIEQGRLRETAKAAKRSLRSGRAPVSGGLRFKGRQRPAPPNSLATASHASAFAATHRWRSRGPTKSEGRSSAAPTLKLNVVYVFEKTPPSKGEPAVEWFLPHRLPDLRRGWNADRVRGHRLAIADAG